MPHSDTSGGMDEELLPILIAPHKTLKTKAREVKTADMDHVRDLVPRMFASMYKAPGIGLAAPQVDVGLRFFIVDLMPNEKSSPIVLVNPEIVRVSEDWATREEGCLSLPNQYADVSRPAMVRVSYSALDGKRSEIDAEGLMAACLQHELDHLDGILFVDHLSLLKRNMLMRKLAKEQKALKDSAKRTL
jgi:peptide deformylase